MKNMSGGNEMKVRLKTGLKLAFCFAAPALAASAQRARGADPASRMQVCYSAPAPDEIVREIADPHTGARWLLLRDQSHPGGPGRLVQVESTRNQARRDKAAVELAQRDLRPVIHAGERLIVEENSPVVETRLEAVALGPAAIGSPLHVRLTIGGKVLRAVALATGRAVLQFHSEVRP